MKTIASLFLLLSIVAFTSCKTAREKEAQTKAAQYPQGELVANFDSFRNSASFTITHVAIDGNNMIIDVEYSGGCEKHEFKLLGSEMIQKSLPPQRGVMLWHNNNGDSCRSIVEEKLTFDISAFAYEGGEIILNLDGWANPVSYTKVK
jgi:hypothetical protein